MTPISPAAPQCSAPLHCAALRAPLHHPVPADPSLSPPAYRAGSFSRTASFGFCGGFLSARHQSGSRAAASRGSVAARRRPQRDGPASLVAPICPQAIGEAHARTFLSSRLFLHWVDDRTCFVSSLELANPSPDSGGVVNT